jgi:hypothetical protein
MKVLRRVLGLVLYGLTLPVIAFGFYATWYGYLMGFNPLAGVPLIMFCIGFAALLWGIGFGLRSSE